LKGERRGRAKKKGKTNKQTTKKNKQTTTKTSVKEINRER
jgi:hypothetical protein